MSYKLQVCLSGEQRNRTGSLTINSVNEKHTQEPNCNIKNIIVTNCEIQSLFNLIQLK